MGRRQKKEKKQHKKLDKEAKEPSKQEEPHKKAEKRQKQGIQTKPANSGKLYMIDQNTFEKLSKKVRLFKPQQRSITLVMNIYDMEFVNPAHPLDDPEAPTEIIFFCIRCFVDQYFQPIGCLQVHSKLDQSRTIATCIRGYITDLWNMGLYVTATVSPPLIFFKKIVSILAENRDFDRYPGLITYNVYPIQNIVHIYDIEYTLVKFQSLFRVKDIKYECCSNWLNSAVACWSDVCYVLNNVCNLKTLASFLLPEKKIPRRIHIFTKDVCINFMLFMEQGFLSAFAPGTNVLINSLRLYYAIVQYYDLLFTNINWNLFINILQSMLQSMIFIQPLPCLLPRVIPIKHAIQPSTCRRSNDKSNQIDFTYKIIPLESSTLDNLTGNLSESSENIKGRETHFHETVSNFFLNKQLGTGDSFSNTARSQSSFKEDIKKTSCTTALTSLIEEIQMQVSQFFSNENYTTGNAAIPQSLPQKNTSHLKQGIKIKDKTFPLFVEIHDELYPIPSSCASVSPAPLLETSTSRDRARKCRTNTTTSISGPSSSVSNETENKRPSVIINVRSSCSSKQSVHQNGKKYLVDIDDASSSIPVSPVCKDLKIDDKPGLPRLEIFPSSSLEMSAAINSSTPLINEPLPSINEKYASPSTSTLNCKSLTTGNKPSLSYSEIFPISSHNTFTNENSNIKCRVSPTTSNSGVLPPISEKDTSPDTLIPFNRKNLKTDKEQPIQYIEIFPISPFEYQPTTTYSVGSEATITTTTKISSARKNLQTDVKLHPSCFDINPISLLGNPTSKKRTRKSNTIFTNLTCRPLPSISEEIKIENRITLPRLSIPSKTFFYENREKYPIDFEDTSLSTSILPTRKISDSDIDKQLLSLNIFSVDLFETSTIETGTTKCEKIPNTSTVPLFFSSQETSNSSKHSDTPKFSSASTINIPTEKKKYIVRSEIFLTSPTKFSASKDTTIIEDTSTTTTTKRVSTSLIPPTEDIKRKETTYPTLKAKLLNSTKSTRADLFTVVQKSETQEASSISVPPIPPPRKKRNKQKKYFNSSEEQTLCSSKWIVNDPTIRDYKELTLTENLTSPEELENYPTRKSRILRYLLEPEVESAQKAIDESNEQTPSCLDQEVSQHLKTIFDSQMSIQVPTEDSTNRKENGKRKEQRANFQSNLKEQRKEDAGTKKNTFNKHKKIQQSINTDKKDEVTCLDEVKRLVKTVDEVNKEGKKSNEQNPCGSGNKKPQNLEIGFKGIVTEKNEEELDDSSDTESINSIELNKEIKMEQFSFQKSDEGLKDSSDTESANSVQFEEHFAMKQFSDKKKEVFKDSTFIKSINSIPDEDNMSRVQKIIKRMTELRLENAAETERPCQLLDEYYTLEVDSERKNSVTSELICNIKGMDKMISCMQTRRLSPVASNAFVTECVDYAVNMLQKKANCIKKTYYYGHNFYFIDQDLWSSTFFPGQGLRILKKD